MRTPTYTLSPARLSAHRHAQARMVRMSLYIYEMETVLAALSDADYNTVLLALRKARESIADAQAETAAVGRPYGDQRLAISVAS